MIEKFRSLVRREKAFTLVELLIVIAIIAILTVAFLPGALKAPAKARDAGRLKTMRDIQATVEAYIAENNGAIPASHTSNCFLSSLVIASNFNPLPTDPRPPTVGGTVTGSCITIPGGDNNNTNSASSNKYFYRSVAAAAGQQAFYVIGAHMEIQASGNTTAVLAGGANNLGAGTTWSGIRGATAITGGGTVTSPTPNATNPFFIVIGPQ